MHYHAQRVGITNKQKTKQNKTKQNTEDRPQHKNVRFIVETFVKLNQLDYHAQ
jgi:hypothetical protein